LKGKRGKVQEREKQEREKGMERKEMGQMWEKRGEGKEDEGPPNSHFRLRQRLL